MSIRSPLHLPELSQPRSDGICNQLTLSLIPYLLIGMALALFFLLRIAFAEHLGFGPVYLIASTSVVLLKTLDCIVFLPKKSLAFLVAALVAPISQKLSSAGGDAQRSAGFLSPGARRRVDYASAHSESKTRLHIAPRHPRYDNWREMRARSGVHLILPEGVQWPHDRPPRLIVRLGFPWAG